MARIEVVLAARAALLVGVGMLSACTPGAAASGTVTNDNPTCSDCGSDCSSCQSSSGVSGPDGSAPKGRGGDGGGGGIDGVKDGSETDVDCGGPNAPPCAEGKSCLVDSDCTVACNYAHTCVSAPSCKTHLGGDTCGIGEVGELDAQHESCCRSLPVTGYVDPMHPGKKVYLDKYEITAGRIRAWVEQLAAANGGTPDLKAWLDKHRPEIWDKAWDTFMPAGWDGPSVVIARRLLGDVRPEDNNETTPPTTGVILPPATDQPRNMGFNYQFGSEVYVDLHGSDCATWDGSFGYPTYWYPADILKHDGELPRVDGIGYHGEKIAAKDLLDVKAMNCIPNAMLAAFCAWDGGQLVTDEVLDYITASPPSLGSISGCGTQIDDHDELLGNIFTHTVQTGGRCAPVSLVNVTFDGGDTLPVEGSPLNAHNYWYPDLGTQTHDKAWQISPPGRASLAVGAQGQAPDAISLKPGDEPWMDLAGNLSEAALDTDGGKFTGLFALKYRGIAYGTARSDLNFTLMKGETILRIQRPEAKGGFTGGRCMRFR